MYLKAATRLTLWLAISVGKSIFRKHFFGLVLFLIALIMPSIIGKQAWAARIKSLTLISPYFLESIKKKIR